MKIILLFFICILISYSCKTESYQCCSGTVYDEETMKPIYKAAVWIELNGSRNEYFTLTNLDGDFFHCSEDNKSYFPFDYYNDVKVLITMPGYFDKRMEIGDDLEIYMKKKKQNITMLKNIN